MQVPIFVVIAAAFYILVTIILFATKKLRLGAKQRGAYKPSAAQSAKCSTWTEYGPEICIPNGCGWNRKTETCY